jgi:Ca2+-binding RTX toxin-like protein
MAGAGAALLLGGGGRNLLIGGPGADTLNTGSGADLLLGVTTAEVHQVGVQVVDHFGDAPLAAARPEPQPLVGGAALQEHGQPAGERLDVVHVRLGLPLLIVPLYGLLLSAVSGIGIPFLALFGTSLELAK